MTVISIFNFKYRSVDDDLTINEFQCLKYLTRAHGTVGDVFYFSFKDFFGSIFDVLTTAFLHIGSYATEYRTINHALNSVSYGSLIILYVHSPR